MSHSLSPAAARPSRLTMRVLFGSALIAVAASTMSPAFAQGHHGPGGMGPAAMGQGPGGPFGGSPRHIERMLDGVNATDAQRAQIKQIVAAAAVDMKAQREAGRSLRERSRQIFTAPTIDANAAEQVRLQMLTQHDQMSRKTLQVMLDVAQVLTPEQRAKIGAQMARRGEQMREHQHERPAREGAAPRS